MFEIFQGVMPNSEEEALTLDAAHLQFGGEQGRWSSVAEFSRRIKKTVYSSCITKRKYKIDILHLPRWYLYSCTTVSSNRTILLVDFVHVSPNPQA